MMSKRKDVDEFIKINLNNAKAVANGNYSGLFCSRCEKQSVEAFFSEHNLKKGYGIWFECQLCKNVDHISCGSRPEGFTPLRVSDKFQIIDERAWEKEGDNPKEKGPGH